MADPLSIAASVAGLLGVGVKLVEIMSPIVNNADAPPLCRAVLTELCNIQAILRQFKDLFGDHLTSGVGAAPPERRELVPFEHLAAALIGCVLTKAELETLVDDLGLVYSERGVSGIFDRARWMRKEKAIARLLVRLQDHKGSLSCMLSVITAGSTLKIESSTVEIRNSTVEIQNKVAQLYTLFERTLANHPELSVQLARLEGAESTVGRPDTEINSVLRGYDGGGDGDSIRAARQLSADDPVVPDAHAHAHAAPDLGSQLLASLALELETVLQGSMAYRRHLLTTSDAHSETSATTSTRRRAAASIFSALSLADISNLSVCSLPILIQEVGNNHWYIQVGPSVNKSDSSVVNKFYNVFEDDSSSDTEDDDFRRPPLRVVTPMRGTRARIWFYHLRGHPVTRG
ncbi:hypothetical protein RB597_005263 [Gaeumannomyces tritici]